MNAFQNNANLQNLCHELTQPSALVEQFSGSTIFEKVTLVRFDIKRIDGFHDCVALQEQLGIPAMLFSLAQLIANELPKSEAKTWSNRFYASIRLGANLSCVWPRLAAEILSDLKADAASMANSEEVNSAIDSLSRLCRTTQSAPENKTIVFETLQKYFDDRDAIAFGIIRSIYWSFTAKNHAQRISNAGDVLNQLAFAQYGKSSTYKAYASLRAGAYVRQAEKLLRVMYSA